MNTLSAGDLEKIDKSNMLGLLLDFPNQCRDALNIALSSKLLFKKRNFKRFIFCGMGGSSAGADLIKSYLERDSGIAVEIFREHSLPAHVDSSTLVFVLSYSGNTEETLSAYNCARIAGSTIIAISSGGALKKRALENKVTFIELPKGLFPRCALGYLSIIPLCVFEKISKAKGIKQSCLNMISLLEKLRDNELAAKFSKKNNIAKLIALKLEGKFGVIYSDSAFLDPCVRRFRSQLAENAKALSSSHSFPEAAHNEIMGWQNPSGTLKNFITIFFRDKETHASVARKIDLAAGIIKKEGIDSLEIWARGKDSLSKIFSLIYIGDFISYYLAILYGVDPAPIDRIEFLKKQSAK